MIFVEKWLKNGKKYNFKGNGVVWCKVDDQWCKVDDMYESLIKREHQNYREF